MSSHDLFIGPSSSIAGQSCDGVNGRVCRAASPHHLLSARELGGLQLLSALAPNRGLPAKAIGFGHRAGLHVCESAPVLTVQVYCKLLPDCLAMRFNRLFEQVLLDVLRKTTPAARNRLPESARQLL